MIRAFLQKYFWSILASLIALVLSVAPFPEMPEMADVPLMDKWVHMFMYGGVASAIWFDNYRTKKDHSIHLAVVLSALLWPLVLGGGMELWQKYLTDNRSGEWLDFSADALGAVIAMPVGLWLIRPYAYAIWGWLIRRQS